MYCRWVWCWVRLGSTPLNTQLVSWMAVTRASSPGSPSTTLWVSRVSSLMFQIRYSCISFYISDALFLHSNIALLYQVRLTVHQTQSFTIHCIPSHTEFTIHVCIAHNEDLNKHCTLSFHTFSFFWSCAIYNFAGYIWQNESCSTCFSHWYSACTVNVHHCHFCFTPDRLTGDPKDSLVALDLGGGSTQITFVPIKPDTLTSTPADYLTTISLLRQNLNLYTHRLVNGWCMMWSNPSTPVSTYTHLRLTDEGIKRNYLWRIFTVSMFQSVELYPFTLSS